MKSGYTLRVEVSRTLATVEGLSEYRRWATVEHLIDTFGSREAAVEWLNEFCPALGLRPVELMQDEQGRLTVNQVLVCIDHGMIY